VKAYALESALDDLAPAVGNETMILPVLNGMRHIDVLTARFGEMPVLGGVAVVATTLDDAGRIVQLADIQQLTYGERSGGSSARIEALDGLLQGAAFDARSSTTIMQAMWEKWVMLASLGAITCLMRGTVGEVEATPGGADLALQMLAECAAVAAAEGYTPSEEFLTRTKGALTAPGSGLASSMYRDLQQGRSVEVDQILGDLLVRAHKHAVPATLVTAAFVQLSIYQRRL
jgi:2-dehydropantoate 2-reductase